MIIQIIVKPFDADLMSEVAHKTSKKQEMDERWLPIIGYENRYEISSLGRVRSFVNGKYRVLKPGKNTGGYPQVNLCKSNKRKQFLVHRLVASAFVPNPLNLPEIDHIDMVRTNSSANNLRWCTHKENMAFAGKAGRMSRSKNLEFLRKKNIRLNYNCMDPNNETKTFVEIWSCLNQDDKNELSRRLLINRCCTTYQTVWNWGTGRFQPSSPLVRTAIASTVSKFIGKKTAPHILFP